MGTTILDVAREFQGRVQKLEPVVVSFMSYDPRTNRASITTLLDDFDDAAEDQLASVELHLAHTYNEFSFDFSTIHLQGREPKELIPDYATILFRRGGSRSRV